jgi:hypothetical protein
MIAALLLGLAIGSVAQSVTSLVGEQLAEWMVAMNARDQVPYLSMVMLSIVAALLAGMGLDKFQRRDIG